LGYGVSRAGRLYGVLVNDVEVVKETCAHG
jgi:hypothetical protein